LDFLEIWKYGNRKIGKYGKYGTNHYLPHEPP
jgi:hypothetical protein